MTRSSSSVVTLLGCLLACLTAFPTTAQADVFNMPGGQTSVSMVTIGNPGNVPDTGGTVGAGAVSYTYKMDAYDVTTAQYTQFLNAVAATDTYGLYTDSPEYTSMAAAFPTVGITQSGSSGSYTYSVIGNGNVPVFGVTWGDAARFCNWLQNGQPIGAEGNGTTETGAYTLNGAVSTSALMAITRNADATYVIPSVDEWYKAAYYDPTNATYWSYATQSNLVPSNVLSALGTNNANYSTYSLTPVGAFASSPSDYGTFDQAGNVFQWTEGAITNQATRVVYGGSWESFSGAMLSSFQTSSQPDTPNANVGFRVADVTPVPEAGSFTLLAVGAIGVLIAAIRRHVVAGFSRGGG